MAFESLSFRYTFEITNFPERWLPLICLYDPDLPLFPIYYFHVLSDDIRDSQRPNESQRAFGYVEKINLKERGNADITIVTNKNLNSERHAALCQKVINEVKERFGLNNSVTHDDVCNTFSGDMAYANSVLSEIWQRVISNAYGNLLPFGRLWDETLGLTRFVASWNSPSGRKGELIQTHYFVSKFGNKIQSSGEVPQVDFYLLPTIKEITNGQNPLTIFPNYAQLLSVAKNIQVNYCSLINIDGLSLSKFNNPFKGKFDTAKIQHIINSSSLPTNLREYAFECFNSFDKGPQRTIIFLLMLEDLRQDRLSPGSLTSSQCGSIYDGLKNTYQSPKAIQIYAQQSFGNSHAMPIDTWIETFFRWPLAIWPTEKTTGKYRSIFSNSQKLGKTERLLWVASQARKVHSSACNDIIWCTKYSSEKKPRGANPLACKICLENIRNCCPAHQQIRDKLIAFNDTKNKDATFWVITSQNKNARTQSIVACAGYSIYDSILDDFSPADDPTGIGAFPAAGHDGGLITVDQFMKMY